MRCPTCSKLYRVDLREVASQAPEFECQSCKTLFTFDDSPKHPHSIGTKLIHKMPTLASAHQSHEKKKTGSSAALMRMWQDLLQDYDNLTKHLAFVDRCEDLQALPYALKRYQTLKEAQPHDEVAQQMLKKVWLKSFERNMGRMAELSKIKMLFQKINWARVAKLAPVVLGLSLILLGSLSGALRNLVGVGSAILLLTIGIRSFRSEKFRLSDYY